MLFRNKNDFVILSPSEQRIKVSVSLFCHGFKLEDNSISISDGGAFILNPKERRRFYVSFCTTVVRESKGEIIFSLEIISKGKSYETLRSNKTYDKKANGIKIPDRRTRICERSSISRLSRDEVAYKGKEFVIGDDETPLKMKCLTSKKAFYSQFMILNDLTLLELKCYQLVKKLLTSQGESCTIRAQFLMLRAARTMSFVPMNLKSTLNNYASCCIPCKLTHTVQRCPVSTLPDRGYTGCKRKNREKYSISMSVNKKL